MSQKIVTFLKFVMIFGVKSRENFTSTAPRFVRLTCKL